MFARLKRVGLRILRQGHWREAVELPQVAMDEDQPVGANFELLGPQLPTFLRQKVAVAPTGGVELFIVSGRLSGARAVAGVILRVEFYSGNRKLAEPVLGFNWSERWGLHTYVAVGDDSAFERLIPVPATADRMRISFRLLASYAQFSNVVLRRASFELLAQPKYSRRFSDPAFHRALAQLADRLGDLSVRVSACAEAYAGSGSEADKRALEYAKGELRELDTSWAPTVRTKAPARPRKDRIAHLHKVVFPFESTGGSVRGLNTVRSQLRAGLSPFVVTPLFYPAATSASVPRKRTFEGIDYYHFTVPRSKELALPRDQLLQYDAALTASVLAKESPSVIHAASGYRGYELALKALPISKALGVPLIYEVRSLHEHVWSHAPEALQSERTLLRMAQENRCMAAADSVVTICQAMARLFVERGIDAEKIVVIPNAVSDEFLIEPESVVSMKRKLGFESNIVVGYISNFSQREGHEVLLHAFARVYQSYPNLRCLLVGNGSTRARCERLCTELGIGKAVTFTGEVSHADIAGYYRAIDLFVVPRVEDYAADHVTPLKPFEALALEVPLIMSDRPVTPEIVGKEERGLVFKTGDDQDLAEKLRTALENPETMRTMARRGRSWVMTERTWRLNASRYCDLYSELAARAHSTSLADVDVR